MSAIANATYTLGVSLRQPLRAMWNLVSRPVIALAGWCFLVVGLIGFFSPVLPGTIFLILALSCFASTNPRVEQWMLDHPRFGQVLRDWRANGTMRRRTKTIAISFLTLGLAISITMVPSWVVKGLLGLTWVVLTWYIARRPEPSEAELPERA